MLIIVDVIFCLNFAFFVSLDLEPLAFLAQYNYYFIAFDGGFGLEHEGDEPGRHAERGFASLGILPRLRTMRTQLAFSQPATHGGDSFVYFTHSSDREEVAFPARIMKSC